MKTGWSTAITLAVVALAVSSSDAWAQAATVTIGARASTPELVEIKAGEEVEWVNAAGGTAHVWFGFVNVLGFYVGQSGVRVQFDRPGTYDYLVHLTIGTSAHSHPGTVVVK